jgi:hypothetical protein
MIKPTIKLAVLCLMLFSIVGCSKVEKVYQWKRNGDETFNLRFKISNNNKKLTLLNQYIKNGIKQTYISDYFSDCQYFNESNFVCVGAPGDEKFVMREGKIIWYYWSEERHYELSPAETFAYTFLLD